MYTLHSKVWCGLYDGNIDFDAAIASAEEELKESESEETETAGNDDSAAQGLTDDSAAQNLTDDDTVTDTSNSEASDAGAVSQEFKDAMDSYEKYFDEYVELMQKMADNPDDLSIFMEYADFIGQYNDMMEKFNALEDSEMTDSERAYYIEVQARINAKLLAAAQ